MSKRIDGFTAFYKLAENTYHRACDIFESRRSAIVKAAEKNLPVGYANIVERISRAVPEALCALSSFTGILTIPACFVSLGRKCVPIVPLIKALARGELDREMLKKIGIETLDGFKAMFENVLVPALLVYFVLDAAIACGVGLFTFSFTKLLYASAVAVPAAWLIVSHMWNNQTPPSEACS